MGTNSGSRKGYAKIGKDPNLIFQAVAGYADALYRDNVSATNFAQTYAPTIRNRTNSAGNLEAVAANTPVIDHVGASLTPALRVEPQEMQLLFGDNTFSAGGGWTLSNVTTAQNAVGPSGAANEAWTATDADGGNVGYFQKSISKSTSDSSTYFQESVAFAKTSGATSFPALHLLFAGVSEKDASYIANTDTGTVTAWANNDAANVAYTIKSEGGFWRLWISATDNGANSSVVFRVVPAANTDAGANYAAATQGSCVIANAKITTGSIPSSYFAGAAAQGDVQNSGTLTIGKPYHIITTEVDHFGSGVIADQYIIAAAETALDANNTVREHGTVRTTEAGTITLAIPAAVATALAASGTIIVDWMPAYNRAAGVVTGIVSTDGNTASLLYTTTAAGNLSSFDGTAVAESTAAYTKNVWHRLVAKWPSDTDKYKVGASIAMAGVAYGSEAAFDGDYSAGANLVIGTALHGPMWIKSIRIYDKVLTDTQINAM